MTSNTAPAHPQATGVAVYPALFQVINDTHRNVFWLLQVLYPDADLNLMLSDTDC